MVTCSRLDYPAQNLTRKLFRCRLSELRWCFLLREESRWSVEEDMPDVGEADTVNTASGDKLEQIASGNDKEQ